MILVVPLVALIGFLVSLLAVIVLRIQFLLLERGGASPTPRQQWWYRSVGQLTLVFFLTFLVTRIYYLL